MLIEEKPDFSYKSVPIPTEEELSKISTMVDVYVAKALKEKKINGTCLSVHQELELKALAGEILNLDTKSKFFKLPAEATKIIKETLEPWHLDDLYWEKRGEEVTKEQVEKSIEGQTESNPLDTIGLTDVHVFGGGTKKERELVLMHLMKDGLTKKLSFKPSLRMRVKYFFNSIVRICNADLDSIPSPYLRMQMVQLGYHPMNRNSIKAFYLLDESPASRISVINYKIKELENTPEVVVKNAFTKLGWTDSMLRAAFPKMAEKYPVTIRKINQLKKEAAFIKGQFQTMNCLSSTDNVNLDFLTITDADLAEIKKKASVFWDPRTSTPKVNIDHKTGEININKGAFIGTPFQKDYYL